MAFEGRRRGDWSSAEEPEADEQHPARRFHAAMEGFEHAQLQTMEDHMQQLTEEHGSPGYCGENLEERGPPRVVELDRPYAPFGDLFIGSKRG